MKKLKNHLILAGVLLLSSILFVNGFAADVDPQDVDPKLEIERYVGLSLHSDFSKTFTMDAVDFGNDYLEPGNVGEVGVKSAGANWGLKVKTDTASVEIDRNGDSNFKIEDPEWQDNLWKIFSLKVSNPSGTWPNGGDWNGNQWIDFKNRNKKKKLFWNNSYKNVDVKFDVSYRFEVDDIESLIETLASNSNDNYGDTGYSSSDYMDDQLSDITASFPLTFYAIPRGDK